MPCKVVDIVNINGRQVFAFSNDNCYIVPYEHAVKNKTTQEEAEEYFNQLPEDYNQLMAQYSQLYRRNNYVK